MEASYISPPLPIVNTATPLSYLASTAARAVTATAEAWADAKYESDLPVTRRDRDSFVFFLKLRVLESFGDSTLNSALGDKILRRN